MPVLDITEYSRLASDATGKSIPTGIEPASATHQVSVGVTSTQSNAFSDSVKLVRIHTDTACRIAFGPNPTASASSPRMAAGSTEFFGVQAGHKIAVIASS